MISMEKKENKHITQFLVLLVIYFVGALADGFGFINSGVNIIGIILQFAVLPFIIVNLVVLFDSGLIPARKLILLNMAVIFVALILIAICYKLKMAAFLITAFVIILLNIVMVITAMYRMTRLYIEVIEHQKTDKNINAPRGRIIDFFK